VRSVLSLISPPDVSLADEICRYIRECKDLGFDVLELSSLLFVYPHR